MGFRSKASAKNEHHLRISYKMPGPPVVTFSGKTNRFKPGIQPKKIIIPIYFNCNLLEPTTAKLIDFGDDEAIPEVVQKTKAKGKRMNVIYAKN